VSVVVDLASWVLLASGGAFCVIGAVGLIRMPGFYTRAHAASVVETLGAGLILIGLLLQAGWTLAAIKVLILALLMMFANPTATHALARAAMLRGIKPVLADERGGPSKP
jgi:multicomponent Na+:H+ antiporter subunit G